MLKPAHHRQQGVVLLITLIVLVIMALATAAMMRSVSSANVIAGNLAFQQAATTSSDQGVEAAVVWLENNNGQSSSTTATACSEGSTVLACDQASYGYLATRTDPSSTQTWADVWAALVTAGTTPKSLTKDAAGNTVKYLIQRMCSATGDAATGTCSISPSSTECGQSHSVNTTAPSCTSQVYYRITVQTSGPHNTTSYTQTMVAM
jgi:type IV pilus assembly protein PilX